MDFQFETPPVRKRVDVDDSCQANEKSQTPLSFNVFDSPKKGGYNLVTPILDRLRKAREEQDKLRFFKLTNVDEVKQVRDWYLGRHPTSQP